jgi:NAD+ kinase
VNPRHIGIVLRREKAAAGALAADLAPWLASQGHHVYCGEEVADLVPGARPVAEATLGQHIDLLVVLGGDGTLLYGTHLVADAGVPVLGVNLGRLGFLAPFDPADARSAVARAIAGELPIEERMRLRVVLTRGPEHAAGPGVVERFALNDAVISQGAMARLVELETTLDGGRITNYLADGLIICTPTGSTAYNLAAGGPILPPWQGAFVITPICPHTLTNRPLVVPSRSTIGVGLVGESRGVMLTVDGQWAHPFLPGDRVEISKATYGLKLFRGERNYFEILRQKLKWGAPNG